METQQAGRVRDVYPTDVAAMILNVKPPSLRQLAKRREEAGSPVAWDRTHPQNPTSSMLFPAEFIIDRARRQALDAGRTPPMITSVPLQLVLPALPGEPVPARELLVDPETEIDLVRGEARAERARREELEHEHERVELAALAARVTELEGENARLRAHRDAALREVETLAELVRSNAVARRTLLSDV